MAWTLDADRPIYTQIVEIIQRQIVSGIYKPGDKMPSVRDMATVAGVNPNTMQRALSELERDRLLYSIRTSGRFVTEDQTLLKELRKDLSSTFIRELYESLRKLGMTDEEIAEAVLKKEEP